MPLPAGLDEAIGALLNASATAGAGSALVPGGWRSGETPPGTPEPYGEFLSPGGEADLLLGTRDYTEVARYRFVVYGPTREAVLAGARAAFTALAPPANFAPLVFAGGVAWDRVPTKLPAAMKDLGWGEGDEESDLWFATFEYEFHAARTLGTS